MNEIPGSRSRSRSGSPASNRSGSARSRSREYCCFHKTKNTKKRKRHNSHQNSLCKQTLVHPGLDHGHTAEVLIHEAVLSIAVVVVEAAVLADHRIVRALVQVQVQGQNRAVLR